MGEPLALCHRCVGMVGGLALGVLAAPVVARPLAHAGRRILGRVPRHHRAGLALLLAAVPTTLDWSLGAAGVVANTPVSRVLTGAIVGAVAGVVIARELLRRATPHPTPRHA
jgi:hypothetical protein